MREELRQAECKVRRLRAELESQSEVHRELRLVDQELLQLHHRIDDLAVRVSILERLRETRSLSASPRLYRSRSPSPRGLRDGGSPSPMKR